MKFYNDNLNYKAWQLKWRIKIENSHQIVEISETKTVKNRTFNSFILKISMIDLAIF